MMPGDIFKNKNGSFVLGGINGLTIFKENDMFSNKLPIKIYFSKIWVNTGRCDLSRLSRLSSLVPYCTTSRGGTHTHTRQFSLILVEIG
jgi:hypothetical protein